MFRSTRAARLLDGRAGARAAGDAAVDVVMKLQRLAREVGDDIAELDANPVLVTASGAVVADALVVPRQSGGTG
jgi:hypothetical protein